QQPATGANAGTSPRHARSQQGSEEWRGVEHRCRAISEARSAERWVEVSGLNSLQNARRAPALLKKKALPCKSQRRQTPAQAQDTRGANRAPRSGEASSTAVERSARLGAQNGGWR